LLLADSYRLRHTKIAEDSAGQTPGGKPASGSNLGRMYIKTSSSPLVGRSQQAVTPTTILFISLLRATESIALPRLEEEGRGKRKRKRVDSERDEKGLTQGDVD
jgi:hypothetical protein